MLRRQGWRATLILAYRGRGGLNGFTSISPARTEANKGTAPEAISCQIMHAARRHDESFT
jgi:hypothetical protein